MVRTNEKGSLKLLKAKYLHFSYIRYSFIEVLLKDSFEEVDAQKQLVFVFCILKKLKTFCVRIITLIILCYYIALERIWCAYYTVNLLCIVKFDTISFSFKSIDKSVELQIYFIVIKPLHIPLRSACFYFFQLS